MNTIKLNSITIGGNNPFVLIAGPCVIESEALIMSVAEEITKTAGQLNIPFVFKSSYRKANRTSSGSFTGIGDVEGLKILAKVKKEFEIPVLTDIHTNEEAKRAAEYVDILQIPAFLCRQTDLLVAAGETGKIVNIKKGQFLAPEDMKHAAAKVTQTGNNNVLLTERGTTFGYHNLVVDMRSLVIMKELGFPVVMDATHSVQLPAQGDKSGGQPKYIRPLARAASAIGIDALFIETHPEPAKAMSDAASQFPLNELKDLLTEIKEIDKVIKKY